MRWTAIALAVSVVAAPASGQVAAIDEGSFTLYRDGERIGREDFSIRSAPGASGRVLVAQATIASGLRRLAPGLNADTTGFPARYQCEIRDSGRVVETYSGQAARERFASRLLRADGESAREFRLPAGTVAVDDDVVHQLWFIVRRGAGATVPILVPRRNVVERVTVEAAGSERLSIDLRLYETTRYRLKGPGGERLVWLAADGRIIKATLPGLHLTAIRD